MSWLSKLKNAILGGGSTRIVDNPTTPVELAINDAGAAAATAAQTATTTAITAAKTTVDDYLTTKVGNVGTEIIDTSLEGLAATAISKMTVSGNKTEEEIAESLSGFLKTLEAA